MAQTTKGRVVISTNVEEQLKLAQSIFDKHALDGIVSPLHALQDYKWEAEGPNINVCLAKHLEAEEHKRKMEEAYRERDKHLPNILNVVRNSGALLKAIHAKNAKRLGEWGFTVDDSPKQKAKK